MTSKTILPKPRSIIPLLLIACLGWLAYRECINLIMWHGGVVACQSSAHLELLPKPLPDTSIAQLQGIRVEGLGFSFQSPWKVVAKHVDKGSVVSIDFKDGGAFLILDMKSENTRALLGTTPKQQSAMMQVYGSQALASNYALMSAELATTPDQVKWWQTASLNTRNFLLLTDKSIDVRNASVVYQFNFGGMRGFQFGNPATSPETIQLDIFDANDRHYKIFIVCRNQLIPQSEINAVIVSIKPLVSHSGKQDPAAA